MLALWPLPFKNVSLKRLRTTKSLIVKLSYQSPRAPRTFHLQDREALTRGRLGFSHFSGKDTKLRNYQKKKKKNWNYIQTQSICVDRSKSKEGNDKLWKWFAVLQTKI